MSYEKKFKAYRNKGLIIINHEGARHCRKPLGRHSVTKGSIYRFFELVTTAPFNCGNSLR